jgi:hypothetical protein
MSNLERFQEQVCRHETSRIREDKLSFQLRMYIFNKNDAEQILHRKVTQEGEHKREVTVE